MEKSVERTQRTYIKLALGILIGFVLFVFACWGGCHLYGKFESEHLSRRAAAYLSGGDLRAGALSARRALQLNPESVSAVRVLARVGELSADKTALEWRRKVVQLEPRSTTDQIALAQCALQFDELNTVEKALAAIDEKGRQSGDFHATQARLEEARRKPAEAKEHWAKALKLDPENKTYQLQFARANLALPNRADHEAARATLQSLRQDPTQRAPATRALIVDGAANRENSEKLRELAYELQAYPNAPFTDLLLYLDILRQLNHPEFTSFLTEIEKKAPSKPTDLASLISWMNKNHLSALAINYSRGLSAEVLTQWPVPLSLAESYANLSDWTGLEQWARTGNWTSFEFLRRAYLARALRGQEKSVAAEREWSAAKKEASSQTRSLAVLTRTIIDWRWTDEAVDLLWSLSKDPAEQKEALRGLYQHYSEVGDTPGLYRVLARLVEVIPGDLALQNNLAQIALLLNADADRARRLAADVYQKEPTNPAYVSTYAFSLYSKGNAAEAAKTMESLQPEQLREPSIAAYYGVILVAAGEYKKAREYLKLGSEARLLPEEKILVAKAANKAN